MSEKPRFMAQLLPVASPPTLEQVENMLACMSPGRSRVRQALKQYALAITYGAHPELAYAKAGLRPTRPPQPEHQVAPLREALAALERAAESIRTSLDEVHRQLGKK